MAPELFTEARYMPGEIKPDNRPRDIYAFGCTMLEVIFPLFGACHLR